MGIQHYCDRCMKIHLQKELKSLTYKVTNIGLGTGLYEGENELCGKCAPIVINALRKGLAKGE